MLTLITKFPEVLAAVEGAVLLVDATKGIQAQTISNLELAQKQNLVIIPAVNKIDRKEAATEQTQKELAELLKISPEEIFLISAKEGTGVKELLEGVINKVPSPKGNPEKPFRALVFDSKYDIYWGATAFLRVVDGGLESGRRYLFNAERSGRKNKRAGKVSSGVEAGFRIKNRRNRLFGYRDKGFWQGESGRYPDKKSK